MTAEGVYDRAIEEAAQCMVAAARSDQFATAVCAWILEALQARGGVADAESVDKSMLRGVLEDTVELAVRKSIDELLPNVRERSGEAARVEPYLVDGLRQNLQRIAERLPIAH